MLRLALELREVLALDWEDPGLPVREWDRIAVWIKDAWQIQKQKTLKELKCGLADRYQQLERNAILENWYLPPLKPFAAKAEREQEDWNDKK